MFGGVGCDVKLRRGAHRAYPRVESELSLLIFFSAPLNSKQYSTNVLKGKLFGQKRFPNRTGSPSLPPRVITVTSASSKYALSYLRLSGP